MLKNELLIMNMKYFYIVVLNLLITGISYSQDRDNCSDITKKYDLYKEDSILQSKKEKLGKKLSYKFLLEPENQISLWLQFTTFMPGIIYEGEIFYLYLADSSVIELKLNEDSYPGVMGKHLRSHSFEFVLNGIELQKLKNTSIYEAIISDYDFSDLTGQKQFMQNAICLSSYLR